MPPFQGAPPAGDGGRGGFGGGGGHGAEDAGEIDPRVMGPYYKPSMSTDPWANLQPTLLQPEGQAGAGGWAGCRGRGRGSSMPWTHGGWEA